VKEAGGKNASLGEMFKELTSKGINIPDGFAQFVRSLLEIYQSK
jgi:phosphoenolpyruvate synthase/pyruvate phosphate dikinase